MSTKVTYVDGYNNECSVTFKEVVNIDMSPRCDLIIKNNRSQILAIFNADIWRIVSEV